MYYSGRDKSVLLFKDISVKSQVTNPIGGNKIKAWNLALGI